MAAATCVLAAVLSALRYAPAPRCVGRAVRVRRTCAPHLTAPVEGTSLSSVSPEFAVAAQAQLEVLAAALPVSRAAVYTRRENPSTGALEFLPACVWPEAQG
eukprot:5271483-Prymnesium_polylepis.3